MCSTKAKGNADHLGFLIFRIFTHTIIIKNRRACIDGALGNVSLCLTGNIWSPVLATLTKGYISLGDWLLSVGGTEARFKLSILIRFFKEKDGLHLAANLTRSRGL